MIKKSLDRHIDRNSEALEADSVIFEKNSMYSVKLADAAHEFMVLLVEETKAYCRERGYEINRISYFSAYDADLDVEKAYNSPYSCQIQFKNDIILRLIETTDGKYEAVLFTGAYLEVNEDKNGKD